MSFYDSDGTWSAPTPARQSSWDHQPSQPPSRTSTASSLSPQPDPNAFNSQFEEIDRATDNLMKSGKWYPGSASAASTAPAAAAAAARRESLPTAARGSDLNGDPRLGGGPSRYTPVNDLDASRPGSAGLQGFYAGQRFPGGRQSEAEQMLQAKRRMAAQRERELRNYHQEQQYNRTAVSGVKTDRSMSPSTMSEEDRRELIARQHRALYGDHSSLYNGDASRSPNLDGRHPPATRGPSPLAFDPFGAQNQQSAAADGAVQMPPRERSEKTSPASNSAAQPPFGLLSDAQQTGRSSSSSTAASPPLIQGQKGALIGVAPIGTRPAQAPGPAGGLSKRSTTPLAPSSLSYGFNASDAQATSNVKDERSASSASNPALTDKGVSGLGGWGNNNGVWNSGKSTLAVQPSVWG